MHPVIKISSLIILSIFSTQGGWSSVFLTFAIILPFYLWRIELLSSALQMILRLKWLFFSILLIYYLLSPELNHLLSGLLRISVLISIIFSVNLYLKTTTIEQILASLLWMFSPLKYIKINIERMSLRAVLTIEYIEILTQKLKKYQQGLSDHTIETKCFKQYILYRKERFFYLIKHSGIIIQDILLEASPEKIKNEPNKEYTIECIEAPKVLQSLIPALLCLLYIYNPLSTFNPF